MTCFQSYEWNELLYEEWKAASYQQLFCELYIFTLKHKNEDKIILPLLIQKHNMKTKWYGRKRGLFILGHESYSDYLNAVYDECTDEMFEALFNGIKAAFRNIDCIFTDIRADTKFNRFLCKKDVKEIKENVSVTVSIGVDKEAYNEILSKHTRQNLRTALNRMNKDGLDYALKTLGPIDDTVLLNELRAVHIKRMKNKNGSTTDLLHKLSAMIRKSVCEYREKHNNIIYNSMQYMPNSCLIVVYLNSKVTGYLYGLRDGTIIRIMQNCFDEKYKFYSPMFRGTYDFILSCYETCDVTAIDFTRGNEEYKYKLGGIETKLYTYII